MSQETARLERLVEEQLQLARLDAGALPLEREEVDLGRARGRGRRAARPAGRARGRRPCARGPRPGEPGGGRGRPGAGRADHPDPARQRPAPHAARRAGRGRRRAATTARRPSRCATPGRASRPSRRPFVFDRFYRGDAVARGPQRRPRPGHRPRPGRRAPRQHRRCESGLGEGSTFTLRLPALPGAAAGARDPRRRTCRRPGPGSVRAVSGADRPRWSPARGAASAAPARWPSATRGGGSSRACATSRPPRRPTRAPACASSRLDVADADVGRARASRRPSAHAGGALACLVSNAGYAVLGAVEDADLDEVRAMFETNFFGAAAVLQRGPARRCARRAAARWCSSRRSARASPTRCSACTTPASTRCRRSRRRWPWRAARSASGSRRSSRAWSTPTSRGRPARPGRAPRGEGPYAPLLAEPARRLRRVAARPPDRPRGRRATPSWRRRWTRDPPFRDPGGRRRAAPGRAARGRRRRPRLPRRPAGVPRLDWPRGRARDRPRVRWSSRRRPSRGRCRRRRRRGRSPPACAWRCPGSRPAPCRWPTAARGPSTPWWPRPAGGARPGRRLRSARAPGRGGARRAARRGRRGGAGPGLRLRAAGAAASATPRPTTTRGTGELIRAALDLGARRIIVGPRRQRHHRRRASAWPRALGVRALDADGRELRGARRRHGAGGAGSTCRGRDPRLDDDGDPRWRATSTRRSTGPPGAARVFGPQKGAGARGGGAARRRPGDARGGDPGGHRGRPAGGRRRRRRGRRGRRPHGAARRAAGRRARPWCSTPSGSTSGSPARRCA